MPSCRNAVRRLPFALACAACAVLGCYQSWSDEDADVHDDGRADDATGADRSEDGASDDAPLEDVGPEADAFPECLPEPGDGSWLSFSVDDDPYAAADLSVACTVAEVVNLEYDRTQILMRCDDSTGTPLHVISIRANPHPPLDFLLGRSVRFRHVAVPGFEWTQRHFRLADDEGTVLLAGIDAMTVGPRDVPLTDWYRPYYVDLATGVCPVVPDACGTRERLALDVMFDRDTVRVYDGYQAEVGVVGRVWVHVANASRYHEMTCVDLAGEYYLALFVLFADG